jgi:UDP-glucose 4-epimerase
LPTCLTRSDRESIAAAAHSTVSIALVTGAHGFIGRHVAQRLAAGGATVQGLGHGGWPAAEAGRWGIARWLNGDVVASNLQELGAAGGPLSLVIHLAGGASVGSAIAHPREDFARTVVSTVELLEWMRQESPETRLVVASSAAVYGAGHEGRIAEGAALRPHSPYGHHKLMMESLCRSYAASYGLHCVVARLFSVYGPGLKKQLLWDACVRLRTAPAELELGGHGDELRDWVHVDDIAEVLARLGDLASADVPTFNVGTGCGTSVRSVGQALIAAWATAGRKHATRLCFNGQSRPGDPQHLVAEPSRLHGAQMSCSVPVVRGIAEYVAWFRAQASGQA